MVVFYDTKFANLINPFIDLQPSCTKKLENLEIGAGFQSGPENGGGDARPTEEN